MLLVPRGERRTFACLISRETRTVCSWKGEAHYLNLLIGDEVRPDVAWFYPEPLDAVRDIQGYVAFFSEITVD